MASDELRDGWKPCIAGDKAAAIRTVKPVSLMRTRVTHTNKLYRLKDRYLLISKSYTSY